MIAATFTQVNNMVAIKRTIGLFYFVVVVHPQITLKHYGGCVRAERNDRRRLYSR